MFTLKDLCMRTGCVKNVGANKDIPNDDDDVDVHESRDEIYYNNSYFR